jgi:exopolysaccharide production protein ExoZ
MFLSLQYLRAISAIAVVFFHTYGCFGNQGVAIFFVISGFIMFYIIDKKHKNYKDFLIARVVRVVPLYWLLTTITLLLGYGYDPTIKRIILSYLFLSLGTILPVGWTLTYEFVFYMSCAVIMFFVYKKYYRYFLIIILLIIGDSILNFILHKYGFDYGHYFLLFIGGGMIYILFDKNFVLNFNKYVLYLFFIISLFLTFNDSKVILTYLNYIINVGIPAIFVVWTIFSIEQKYNIYKSKTLLFLGNASYSLYLVHYIVIHILRTFNPEIDNFYLFTISIIFGCLTYLTLEKPLTQYIKNKVYKNV